MFIFTFCFKQDRYSTIRFELKLQPAKKNFPRQFPDGLPGKLCKTFCKRLNVKAFATSRFPS
mgnify:CR=1 FL=1